MCCLTLRRRWRAQCHLRPIGSAPMVQRIPITNVSPVIEQGQYPVKAVVGEPLTVQAAVFREGHDELGAGVVLTDADAVDRDLVVMRELDFPGRCEAGV